MRIAFAYLGICTLCEWLPGINTTRAPRQACTDCPVGGLWLSRPSAALTSLACNLNKSAFSYSVFSAATPHRIISLIFFISNRVHRCSRKDSTAVISVYQNNAIILTILKFSTQFRIVKDTRIMRAAWPASDDACKHHICSSSSLLIYCEETFPVSIDFRLSACV